MTRFTDPKILKEAIKLYSETIVGLDPDEWIKNPANIGLQNDHEDVALFERQWRLPTSVTGHYFFKSRGRAAIKAGFDFLEEIFTGPYGVEMIIGLTPSDHKAALWINRKLGFRSEGEVETPQGPCHLVLLTKADWLQQKDLRNE